MNKRRFRTWICLSIILIAGSIFPLQTAAQCGAVNTAFKSGETLEYKLYFNWKFIWVNAGSATLTIRQSNIKEKRIPHASDYSHLTAARPLLPHARHAGILQPDGPGAALLQQTGFEGKTYRRNEVWYRYSGGKVHVKMAYQRNQLPVEYEESSSAYCMFDMLSMMLRARSFDASDYKVGKRIQFFMPDGRKVLNETLIYRGKKTFEMENTKIKYRCLVFSFVEKEKGKEKEIVKFYITDDKNHLPVRLDMNLNFGTAKAYLTRASNLRNPQTSIIH